MRTPSIHENSFEGAPGGMSGTSNYQTGISTFASPDVSQDPKHFQSSNRNTATGQDNTNSGSLDTDVNAIYAKKDTPTPDDVLCGIKHELGQQMVKNKATAKQKVLANLKKDPKFYSGLKMMGIDDESMMNNMNENKHPNDAPAKPKITSDPDATKQIFNELSHARDHKYVVNSGIVSVMEQMWEEKRQRNAWRKG